MFCKSPGCSALGNAEPLLPGEVRGSVLTSLWSHFFNQSVHNFVLHAVFFKNTFFQRFC